MSERNILIIDDEQAHRLLLKRALRVFDPAIVIQEYSSLPELRKALAATFTSPTVAFVDLNLNGESGLQAIQLLKPLGTISIVLSTSALPAEIAASLQAGAVTHLVKPGNANQLQQLIAEELRKLGM